MKRKANPTLIGIFIVGALALTIGAVLLFSSSRVFTKTKRYILYFDASLTGLDPGTAVKFRGVTIGSVKEVLIHFNQSPSDPALPVIIELNENLLRERSDSSFNLTDDYQLQVHIERGLRGKLDTQSFLTGLLYVDLVFVPGSPKILHQVKQIYSEIPTAPLEIQLLRADFGEITQKLTSILNKLDTSLSQIQVKDINQELTNLLRTLNVVMASPEITNTVKAAHETLDEVRLLSKNLKERVDRLSNAAEGTLAQSQETLTTVQQGVQDLRDVLAPNSPLQRDVSGALEDLSEAARSISTLSDFLKRHPNALLSGRKPSEERPP